MLHRRVSVAQPVRSFVRSLSRCSGARSSLLVVRMGGYWLSGWVGGWVGWFQHTAVRAPEVDDGGGGMLGPPNEMAVGVCTLAEPTCGGPSTVVVVVEGAFEVFAGLLACVPARLPGWLSRVVAPRRAVIGHGWRVERPVHCALKVLRVWRASLFGTPLRCCTPRSLCVTGLTRLACFLGTPLRGA